MKKHLYILIFFAFIVYTVKSQPITFTVKVTDSISGKRLSGVGIIINNSVSDEGTTVDGTVIFFQNAPNIIPGKRISVAINSIPSNLKYILPDNISLQLRDYSGNENNNLNLALLPFKDTLMVYGNITDKLNKPLSEVIVSLEGIASCKSNLTGYYQLYLPFKKTKSLFTNGILPIQFNGDSNYISGHVNIEIDERGATLVNKSLEFKAQPADKIFKLKANLIGPRRYGHQEATIELFQNGIKYDRKNAQLNSVYEFELPKINFKEQFIIKVSSGGLDDAIDTLTISDLDLIKDFELKKTIRTSPFSIYVRFGIQPGWSKDRQTGGGGLYTFKWNEKRLSCGIDIDHFYLSNLIMEYIVFENKVVSTDTISKVLAFGLAIKYNWLAFGTGKNNFHVGLRGGLGKKFYYGSLELGYQRRLYNHIAAEVSPEINYYDIKTQNLQFNYFGDSKKIEESISKFRVNLCFKLIYLIP